jgi:hypothetical protein
MQNHTKFGNTRINKAHRKLHITDASNDFFLQNVSANTEVGNSNIHIQNVKILDINTISKVDNPVYL